ncbi:MAG: AraC family transcriptional regulator [Pseudomonadota bacterium]
MRRSAQNAARDRARQMEFAEAHDLAGEQLAYAEGDRIRAIHTIQKSPETVYTRDCKDHMLTIQLGGHLGSERWYNGKLDRKVEAFNATTLMHADMDTGWRLPKEVEVLHLCMDDSALREFAEREAGIDPSRLEIIDRMGVEDAFVKRLAPLVLNEIAAQSPKSRLMLESFEMLVANHILRAYSNISDEERPNLKAPPKKVSGKALAAACDYITENLHEPLRISEVAAYVNMTPFQLLRAFKAQTGITPHAYLMDQRLTRVRGMLAESHHSLAEVAFACGFSSQAHLNTAFKKRYGTTPGNYRQAVLN